MPGGKRFLALVRVRVRVREGGSGCRLRCGSGCAIASVCGRQFLPGGRVFVGRQGARFGPNSASEQLGSHVSRLTRFLFWQKDVAEYAFAFFEGDPSSDEGPNVSGPQVRVAETGEQNLLQFAADDDRDRDAFAGSGALVGIGADFIGHHDIDSV